MYAEYEVYRERSRSYAECGRLLHNCPAGAALWEQYRAARGPLLTRIPGSHQ